jgi:5'(3')-deoxyribonucleotidase
MKPEILLDIDGVAANFIQGCIPIAEALVGRRVFHDDIDQFMIEHALGLGETQTVALYKAVMTEGWCRSLPAYEGAKEAVTFMREHATVIPVTAHFFDSKHWVYERDAWIIEHLGIPQTDIVHTHRKFQIDGDILIDDKISHLRSWIGRRPSKRGVLFQRRYNQAEVLERTSNITMINGWGNLVAYLSDVYGWPGVRTISLEGRA